MLLGANLVGSGATFRVWAPRAQQVYVIGQFEGADRWALAANQLLTRDALGYWGGFVDGVRDGDEYMFHMIGTGGAGPKRDPYARELTVQPAYPHCHCIVRAQDRYPWHDAGFHPPAFHELIVYQLHVGTFSGPDREQRPATFLDVVERVPYLAALGVNMIEPLPITEFASPRSMGYDGSDLFSPEMDFWVQPATVEFQGYLDQVNELLHDRGHPPLQADQISTQSDQLKALVDLCHVYGLGVMFDVVYNHAGGQVTEPDQDESLWFFDRLAKGNSNDSLYFNDHWHTGPVFAVTRDGVRQFLIDNASFFLTEYHVDGFRYDQVSVLVQENEPRGWDFCQDLTRTLHQRAPSAIQVAEFWGPEPFVVRPVDEGGAGFDASWHDGLRRSIRSAVESAAQGPGAFVSLDGIAAQLRAPNFPRRWKAVQYVESHDEVYRGRNPRIPKLADWNNPRSWRARCMARVAAGLALTAPGIPMLFMGQEFLEDKQWSDNPGFDHGTLIWWEGLEAGERSMVDHLRFMQELCGLRRREPALASELANVFHVHNANRVLAMHRWLPGEGRDVVVVASFNEATFWDYTLGFPRPGSWHEVFNSDVYDNWVNPWASGNGGGVVADGPPQHELPHSAHIVIPANGLLVFAYAG